MSRASDLLLDDGSVAVVKTARGPSAARELRDEGERLRVAAHRGVVEVVRSAGDDEGWELRLVHGGRPVNLLHPAPPRQIAHIASTVAEVLGDLHERGIVHGRLRSDHVLLGPGGRVQLCGFGPGAADAVPADDVAAVGALIVELLGDREVLEPLPDARWHRRRPWPGVARRSLLALADAACVESPSRRPSARRLAAAILEAVPESRDARALERPEPPAGRPRTRRARPLTVADRDPSAGLLTIDEPADRSGISPPEGGRRRSSMLVPKPVVLAAVGVGLLVLALARPGPSRTEVAGPAPDRPTPIQCAVVGPTATEGPCRGPVRVEGTVVIVGTDRFQVGVAGDEVVVGDWDCDGAVTPAVLRRPTGEVFVFPGWATKGDLRVTPEATVPRAARLLRSERCGPPLVERTDGSTLVVELGGAAA